MSQARSRSTDRRYYGVAEAIVTDVNDPEKEGRVKLRYPWFDDQTVSDWCRVRQLYAGNGYGTFFVPEVGDEVLVAFVHGDMRLPIVMGGLYNGSDKPSVFRDGSHDPKLIRTKGGIEVLLDDTANKERVVIKDKKGNTLIFDSPKDEVTLESKGKMKLIAASIDIEASGAITINGSSIDLN